MSAKRVYHQGFCYGLSASIARDLAEQEYQKFRTGQYKTFESDFDEEIKRIAKKEKINNDAPYLLRLKKQKSPISSKKVIFIHDQKLRVNNYDS